MVGHPDLVHDPVLHAQRGHPVSDDDPGLDGRAAGDHMGPVEVLQTALGGQLRGDLDEQLRLQLRQVRQGPAHPTGGVVFGQACGGEHEREHLAVRLGR